MQPPVPAVGQLAELQDTALTARSVASVASIAMRKNPTRPIVKSLLGPSYGGLTYVSFVLRQELVRLYVAH